MKYIVSFILLATHFLFAQEGERPGGVELPTFVITGKDVVELPVVQKLDIQLTPVLPASNFNPVFKPIKFSRREFKPAFKELELPVYSFNPQFKGEVELGFGNIKTPTLNADLMYITRELTANAGVNGYNSKAFIENSEQFFTGTFARLNYYPYDAKGFFSDIFMSSGLNTHYSKYKLYGYSNPLTERNLKFYDIDVKFQKGKHSPFFLSVSAENRSTIIKEESFNSNVTLLNSQFGLHFANFRMDVDGEFYVNKETITSSIIQNQFLLLKGSLTGMASDLLSVSGGAILSRNSTDTKISPLSSIRFRVFKEFEIGADYSSQHNFRNNAQLIRNNKYMNLFLPADLTSLTEKNISVFLKYELPRTLCALLTLSDIEEKGYVFIDYNDSTSAFFPGRDDITGKKVSFDFSLHLGSLGSIHTDVEVNSFQTVSGGEVRGVYPFSSTISYTINPLSGFETSIALLYKAPYFYTTRDLSKIDPSYNLSLGANYSISDIFTLNINVSNLLDQKYYYFYNYLEPGRSVEAGFTFNW
ncbi:MAG: hypothetical protein HUU54_11760 [Ignavibacteriaceae bacterium]|nr:hypothetical protein [Ignavibacteriaceae bacterium]